MDTLTIQLFAATRDSLKGRNGIIKALIDIAEGYPFPIGDQWTYNALVKRGLMVDWVNDTEAADRLMAEYGTPYILTDYGRAFVAWYRNPQDLPAQLDMFDAL